MKEFDLKKDVKDSASFHSYYLAFLPDGKSLLLKDGREAIVRLLDVDNGGVNFVRFGMRASISTASIFQSDAKAARRCRRQRHRETLPEVATARELLAAPANKRTDDWRVTFSPDDKTLATGDSKGDVRLWDAATGKLVHTLEARMEVNWTDEAGKKHVQKRPFLSEVIYLCFSPDGWKPDGEPRLLAGDFWDPSTGKEIRRLGRYSARKVCFLPDGKSVLLGGDMNSSENMLSFLDAKTGEPRRVFDGHHSSVKAVAFSPDGHYVATCEEGPSDEVPDSGKTATTGRVVFQDGYKHRGWAEALAFSPKGTFLAAGHVNEITLWDWKNGKLLQELPAKYPVAAGVLPATDGTRLASCDRDGIIRMHDWASNKELQKFPTQTKNPTIAFSPDLTLAASSYHEETVIRLWDLATGKEWKCLQRDGGGSSGLAFSADGRTLLEIEGTKNMYLWEVVSGEQRRAVSLARYPSSIAFSPDGRRIALGEFCGMNRIDRKDSTNHVGIQIYDVAANRVVSSLLGHEGLVSALSFSPNSRILASAGSDTTALLWDAAALPGPGPAVPLTANERAACWVGLGGNAQEAYACMWKLVVDKEALHLLRENLKPGAPASEKEVRRLVTDLSSDQFAVRSQASKELAKLGTGIAAELRKTLAPGMSLETRRRVEELLRSIATQHLRNGRAIEVLETINTPAARRVLETLATGQDEVRQTREAKASLERLD